MLTLFFDTETTGIKTYKNPGFKPKLVQLGAILQDMESGRIVGELNLLHDLQEDIPFEAAKVHGITCQLTEQAGFSIRLIDRLFGQMVDKADVIVAHNIDYDMDVVADNLPETKLAASKKTQFCTMKANIYIVKAPLSAKQKAYFTSKGKMPDFPYKVPNLTETYKYYFGEEFEGAHDAMADIRACRDIYSQLMNGSEYYDVADGMPVPSAKLRELMTIA